jgi:hypothetical protein
MVITGAVVTILLFLTALELNAIGCACVVRGGLARPR